MIVFLHKHIGWIVNYTDLDNQIYTLIISIQKDNFVAKHNKLGDKWIIIVPKDHLDTVKNMKNPLQVTIQEIFGNG